jgi:beta-glucosidase
METPKTSDKFYFGVATAAHQIEGNNHNDWSEWEKENSVNLAKKSPYKDNHPEAEIPQNYVSGAACNGYELFKEDIQLAKSLGCNAYRFSLEWSRIEPEDGKFDGAAISRYREMLKAVHAAEMEPFLTLQHFTLPLWVEKLGGIASSKFAHYFERFSERIGNEFKNEVKFISPINEPEVLSLNGYYRGIWPPSKKSFFQFRRARKSLIKAHILSYKKLKEINPNFIIGPVCNLSCFESAGGIVNSLLKNAALRFWNFYFLDRVKKFSDFIGINYYFHNRIDWGFNKNKNERVSDMGWELYPLGIENVITETYSRYKLPIFITENGLADSEDRNRPWFIEETFKAMSSAIKKGADLRGYFHWSLLDNFEWDKGFWPKFGLFKVDLDIFERKPRGSAKVYADKIKKFIND